MKKYNPKQIEGKWQKFWATKNVFSADDKSDAKKKFVLIEFPYPSGTGLHMGHMRPFIAGDVVSKYWKLKGKNVLYPIGWDAFGLPAENFAIKNKVHPAVSTKKNIANAKKQLLSWGTGFDWTREINTTDPEYYKWTQWLFLQFLKHGLAYQATGLINWCPKDKTGLANEEVIDGKCERCGTPVEKKELRQWYLKITDYAEKLLDGLKHLPEWPDAVKTQQENWIGRSEGAEFSFELLAISFQDDEKKGQTAKSSQLEAIKVFTTRADTLYGVTYLVLSPENQVISNFKGQISNWEEVESYINLAKNKTEIERTAEVKDPSTGSAQAKTGVELKGIKAVNPANGEEVPVWVADYVLAHYGTGAVMAVPAHDERDFEFAKKYNLKILPVVFPKKTVGVVAIELANDLRNNLVEYTKFITETGAFVGDGYLINSGLFDGNSIEGAQEKITQKFGQKKTTYKLRDWVFSRQRYWGEPIPVIHCDKCAQGNPAGQGIIPVPEKDLPVLLPKVKNYEPTGTGESPLAAIEKWVNVKCPECGKNARRETNTMPQWAGSSWYWLRYADPKNKKEFASQEKLKKWTPVDAYFGGMEHTTLHLLYSRFWNLFLSDLRLVTTEEPFIKRIPHGLVLGPDGEKMSKSKGNTVSPDDFVVRFGADTTRMYMMFLGPHGNRVPWNEEGIIGTRRFIEKVWRLTQNVKLKAKNEKHIEKKSDLEILLNKTIKKVGEDIEGANFNTAISALMILVNEIEKQEEIGQEVFETLLKLVSPFAPHLAEELWSSLGNKKTIYVEGWPTYDETKIVSEKVNIMIQVGGKTRASISTFRGRAESEVRGDVEKMPEVQKWLNKGSIKKVIYIKDRIINFVIEESPVGI